MTPKKQRTPSVSLSLIVTYLDDMLQTTVTPDYPNALNGLQLSNRGKVRKVAGAVDFSTQVVDAAIQEDANLLLVHHGMFWSGLQPIVGQNYARFSTLLDGDMAVYASHLPLDRHPQLGNNVLLAKTLGLDPSGEFARFKDIFIGVRGRADIATSLLVERAQLFSRANGGDAIATGKIDTDRRTRRWAICTGAGASTETLIEATEKGIDTLIVGEGPHWTAVDARERGITIIYLGHYASETLGIYALAHKVSRKFRLDWVKIPGPTGL
jgi:dinuclear metal center YbgI/SA1388 family protein